MNELKGRHLAFLLALCSIWTIVRIANSWPYAQLPAAPAVIAAANPFASSLTGASRNAATGQPVIRFNIACCRHSMLSNSLPLRHAGVRATSLRPSTPEQIATVTFNAVSTVAERPTKGDSPASAVRGSAPILNKPRRLLLDIYAYSFWRGRSAGSSLAAAGQYGGSQSGMIATLALTDAQGQPAPIALLLRAASAHDVIDDRELAFGARWTPKAAIPVSLSGEFRSRGNGSTSFAAYVAGGRNDVRLPARFTLDAYAQAGFVSGDDGSHFFDARVIADRRIAIASPVPLHIGVGIWAGGQGEVARLDVGPTFRTELPVGATRIRVTADWRFRVAGKVSPGNGPALTLSTGF